MNPYLITQLRNAAANGALCREAADEIERLRSREVAWQLRTVSAEAELAAGVNPYRHDHNPLNADITGGFCSACEWEYNEGRSSRQIAVLHQTAQEQAPKHQELTAGVRLGVEIYRLQRRCLAAESDADRLYDVLLDCVAPHLEHTEAVIEAKLKHDDAVLFRGGT